MEGGGCVNSPDCRVQRKKEKQPRNDGTGFQKCGPDLVPI